MNLKNLETCVNRLDELSRCLAKEKTPVQKGSDPLLNHDMLSVLLATAVLSTAAGVGLAVGRERPALGVLAAAGVLLAAVAGYCVLLALSLPM